MKEEHLTIGVVARLGGVGVETVRFYEREGLIPEPPRRDSGYRQYPQNTVDRVHFIKKAKDLGFTLAEIKELLSLRVGKDATCADVKRKAEEKIRDVEARIVAMERIKGALKRLTDQCRGKGPVSDCPILEALERQDDS